MVKGSKALLWGLALMMGGTGAAEAASQLLCGMRWSSANEAVDQRLGGDCMLVTAEGALQVPQLFQQVAGGCRPAASPSSAMSSGAMPMTRGGCWWRPA